MKILMVIDTLRAGGKERRLIELVKSLQANKTIICEIIILSNTIEYQEILSSPIKIHQLKRRSKKDAEIFIKIYKVIKTYKPDIVHVWELMSAVYATPVAKIAGLKVVNSIIGDAPENLIPFQKRWLSSKFSFTFASAIISNSEAGLKIYNPPIQKSHIFRNGFNFERLNKIDNPIDIRKQFAIYTKKTVGMVAAFSKFKDYETFIQAANIVMTIDKDVSFVCVGTGENLHRCKELVDKDFVEKVLFCGHQSNVLSIINLFEIGVLATFTEGISNAIMEYMALGKPVIATKGGGTEELVLNDKTGYLIEQRKPEILAAKILHLLHNPEVARKMGELGRERLSREFGMAKMTESYVKLYHQILNVTDKKNQQVAL